MDPYSFQLLDPDSDPYSEYGSGPKSRCWNFTIILNNINKKFFSVIRFFLVKGTLTFLQFKVVLKIQIGRYIFFTDLKLNALILRKKTSGIPVESEATGGKSQTQLTQELPWTPNCIEYLINKKDFDLSYTVDVFKRRQGFIKNFVSEPHRSHSRSKFNFFSQCGSRSSLDPCFSRSTS